MKDFDYDLNKYITSHKKERDEAKNSEKMTLFDELEYWKKEARRLKAENEVARNIIDSYENECKLSGNAKRFVHDIAKEIDNNYKIEKLERFAFYERAKNAFAVIATGEEAIYANLIIKKGVIK